MCVLSELFFYGFCFTFVSVHLFVRSPFCIPACYSTGKSLGTLCSHILTSVTILICHTFFLCYWLMIHVICLPLTTDTMIYIVDGNRRLITGESPWLSSHHIGMMVRKYEDPNRVIRSRQSKDILCKGQKDKQ